MLTSAIDRVRLHLVLGNQLRRLLAEADRPADEGRVLVVGPHPIRVLLVGAGLAPGYGVTDRKDALDGALGSRLAATTGRGVTVDHRTRPELPMSDTIALLGEVGAHTYDAVIWCPTFTELPFTPSFAVWTRRLADVVRRLETTGTRWTRLVLLGLPPLNGSPRLDRISSGWMSRINTRIRAVADRSSNTTFLQPPPVTVRDPHDLPLGAEYYADVAQLLTAHLHPLLTHSGG
jgi:hypothetical protein